MKYLFLTILSLITSSVCMAHSTEADSLVIRFFKWNIEDGPHFGTCISFEREYPYNEYVISDTSAINLLEEKLGKLHQVADSAFHVSCKLIYVKNGTASKVIGLNEDCLLMNGTNYQCDNTITGMIDSLMQHVGPSSRGFRYRPEMGGEEYIYGQEQLKTEIRMFYNKINREKQIEGKSILRAFCKADRMGNTTLADVKFYNDSVSEDDKKAIVNMFNKWFFCKVKWKNNDTRMKTDWIEVYCRLSE